jgi:RNA recognition motif-containing protein
MQCSIKNTFLTLEEEKPVIRRSYTTICLSTSTLLDEDCLSESTRTSERSISELQILLSPSASSVSTASRASPKKGKKDIREQANADKMGDNEKTTLMIRNIPNRYTPEWLLEEIMDIAECDFLHLPKANQTAANLGYAFVNFTSATGAQEFLMAFEGHQFAKQPNSSKRAKVTFAELQGLQPNVDFYNQPKIANKLARKPWVASA